MPDPKSGTAGTLVAPAPPRSAVDADNAIPGDAEKNRPITPPVHKPDPKKTGWVEVAMLDEDGAPVAGMAYSVTLPNGRVAQGTLDEKGVARIEGFDPGTCQMAFPQLHPDAWEKG